MKYQKTLQIWGNEDKISNGQIKIQVGQWVKCGDGKSSRFVGTRRIGGALWIAHARNGKVTNKSFLRLLGNI